MQIFLYDFIDGTFGESGIDIDAFIERNGVGRLEYNLENLWITRPQNGETGFESDGPCIFVDFN